MLWKRIIAAITVILVVTAIVLLKDKSKKAPLNQQIQEQSK
jgi:hypothetical protein